MSIPDRQDKPYTNQSEQGVLNESRDEKYKVLAVELLVENDAENALVRLKRSDLGGGGGSTTWSVNDISDGATSYFGKTTSDGQWQIVKVTDTSVSYATVSNNGTVTSYTDAWTAKNTLNYGRFDEAF